MNTIKMKLFTKYSKILKQAIKSLMNSGICSKQFQYCAIFENVSFNDVKMT